MSEKPVAIWTGEINETECRVCFIDGVLREQTLELRGRDIPEWVDAGLSNSYFILECAFLHLRGKLEELVEEWMQYGRSNDRTAMIFEHCTDEINQILFPKGAAK